MTFSADDLDDSNARQVEKTRLYRSTTTLYGFTEHYPDGGTWRHGSWPRDEAEDRAEEMRVCHPGRTYVVSASDV